MSRDTVPVRVVMLSLLRMYVRVSVRSTVRTRPTYSSDETKDDTTVLYCTALAPQHHYGVPVLYRTGSVRPVQDLRFDKSN